MTIAQSINLLPIVALSLVYLMVATLLARWTFDAIFQAFDTRRIRKEEIAVAEAERRRKRDEELEQERAIRAEQKAVSQAKIDALAYANDQKTLKEDISRYHRRNNWL